MLFLHTDANELVMSFDFIDDSETLRERVCKITFN